MNKKIIISLILSFVMLASIPAAVFADTSEAAKKQQQQQQDQKKGKKQKSNVKQAQYDQFNRDRDRTMNREERKRERERYKQDRERRDRGVLTVTLNNPGYSRTQDVTLRGRAFGSERVRIFVNGRFLGSTPVGGDGRYEKAVRLRTGENRIRVTVTRGNTTRTVMKIIRVR